jgi:Putative regulator of cell autolysis
MKWMQEQKKHENLTYLALWGMLFAVPVLSLYVRSVNDTSFSFQWGEVLMIWKQFAIYLAIFLLHNFLLAPLLVYKQRRALYFSIIAVILGAFIAYQCSNRPPERRAFHHDPPPFEQMDQSHRQRPPLPQEFKNHRPHRPPVMVGQHDVVALIILILMLGMNIGIKLYFKSRHDAKQLMALEKENLEQQLEYLRYQINPHFFMNTLNNIHALVDIDPEKAKDTILELSKMMRFVLYEGDKKGVPLSREFDFIRHYVTLMQLRYTDKVDVKVDLPIEAPDYELPPLMLITFIENAFKHGISYEQDSFIHIKASIDNARLHFECSNSKALKPNEEKGGVGLANVKQRLNLLYGENYTLNIQDEPDSYNVKLEIPLT